MKQITVDGFSYDATPDTKPAICVYGEENVGKSRFGCTAPHDDGVIGWLALDKNSKGAVDRYTKAQKANHIVVNQKPFITSADAVKLAMTEDPNESKKLYTEILKVFWDKAMKLASHGNVESIVVDDGSQLYDWILFSHFGRKNQIDSFLRGAPNNDFIELVTAMGSKNLVMICRGTEVWADTGEIDKQTGRKKQAPTGKLKPEGFGKIGKFMTAVIELTAARKAPAAGLSHEEALAAKYKARIVTCKGDTLLEGQDLTPWSVCGSEITWDNVMNVIKA